MKKVLSCIMTIMIMTLFAGNVIAAESQTVIVKSYSVSKNQIYKGVEFDLDVTLQNTTNNALNNVYIVVQSSSFQMRNSSNIIPVSGGLGANAASSSIKIPLICTGESTQLTLVIKHGADQTTNVIGINTISDSGSPSTPTDTSKRKPILNVVNGKIPEGKAGGRLNLALELMNNSSYTAKDVMVTAEFDANVFESNYMTGTKNIGNIGAKKKVDLNYELRIKSGVVLKDYPITLKYSYKNSSGNPYEASETIKVKVLSGFAPATIEIDNITTNPSYIEAGGDAELSFDLINSGIFHAKDIKVSLKGLSENGFSLSEGINNRNIKLLMGKKAKETVSFKIHADAGMTKEVYELTAKIDYTTSENIAKTVEFPFSLKVASAGEENLYIENITVPTEDLVPGEAFDVTFDVVNNGQATMKNYSVSIKTDDAIITKSQSIQLMNELMPGEKKSFTFKLQPSELAAAKTYLLNIEAKKLGQEKTKTFNQYTNVQVGKGTDIRLSNLKSPSNTVAPGNTFVVGLDVTNRGIGTAEDIRVSVNGGQNTISKSQSVIVIDSLASGEKKTVSFEMQATSGAAAGNQNVTIEVQAKGQAAPMTQNIGVYIEGSQNSKSVPKIIIGKYKSEPAIVKAGANYDLEVSFLNTHKIKTVSNIKIFLTVDAKSNETGTVFTPVDCSNTLYIDHIAPGQSVVKNLTMYTIPDALSKTYTVKANLEYEDKDGNQYTATELIGVPVTQPSKLDMTEMNIQPNGFVGKPNPLEFQVFNTGKVKINNCVVKVEGDFNVDTMNSFIGNVQIGESKNFYADITSNNMGPVNGKVIVSYEDPTGEKMELTKEFSFTATEKPVIDFNKDNMNDLKPELEEEKEGPNKILIIVSGIFLLSVVAFIVIRIRNKKKKGMTLDE